MADEYIAVDITVDETTLADNAIARLQATWQDTGWEPNEGDLEVVQIEALAQMASDVAQVAAIMPDEAFHTMMERLFGVEIDDGLPATGAVTFTMVDAEPYVIPAGTEIDIDGYAFATEEDVNTAAVTVPGVPVTATEAGVAFNGLTGDAVVMLSAVAAVAEVSLDGPTGGATDPETEAEFLSKGSRQLELLARTLVTDRDYELLARMQPTVERVVVQNDHANRVITVTASAANGDSLPAPEKTKLLDLYEEYRQTTWNVVLADATKTTINVTFSLKLHPGYITNVVLEEAAANVRTLLDATSWGSPGAGISPLGSHVIVEPLVRKNKVIDMIGNASGVNYVVDVTITGSAGSAQPNGDWLMPGTVPLPVPGTVTGTAV